MGCESLPLDIVNRGSYLDSSSFGDKIRLFLISSKVV